MPERFPPRKSLRPRGDPPFASPYVSRWIFPRPALPQGLLGTQPDAFDRMQKIMDEFPENPVMDDPEWMMSLAG